MSVIDSHRKSMQLIVDYLVDTKGYMEDVTSDVPVLADYLEQIDVTDLETYLINKMSYPPSMIESAVQEAYVFISSLIRDNEIRNLSRGDYINDSVDTLSNDSEHYRGLLELQAQYILGGTPQQRS